MEDNASNGRIVHSAWIMMDIVATMCDLAGIPIPDSIEGESFKSILHGNDQKRKEPIFWEHQGNRAVRKGKWKLVHRRCDDTSSDQETSNNDDGWELYNMLEDRTELNNLAAQHKERVSQMSKMWMEWASRINVKHWPLKPLPEGEKDWSNIPWEW